MLTKIREKSQGAFSWLLLLIIVIPFTLWGIENYIKGGSEKAIASVGHRDFFQQDVNDAYQQYSQNFAGMGIAEDILKKQALHQLIKDEVLLQYTEAEGLVSTDADTRSFIQDLDYFKVNGQFDKNQYKKWLAARRLSSVEFTRRVKKSQIMLQFQRSITDSSFVTPYDLALVFKLQNQLRDIDYLTIPLKPAQAKTTDDEINAYYKQHQAQFQTQEKMAIDYVTLSLANLAKEVKVSDAQLKSFYDEQKNHYGTKEQRKLSHILIAVSSQVDDKTALEKANAVLEKLKTKPFEAVAAELSDDKSSANKGGDLGLFEPGTMSEKTFDEAANQLKLNEISKPVKTKYGYHLIKLTELVPAKVKSFDEVKADLTKAYQHKEAETNFYALIDKITEVSYQNPDSLTAVADALGVSIEKTKEFTRDSGEGIAKEKAVRSAAFSDEVLKGNNSEPVELGSDKVVVLRMSAHHPATTRNLKEVKADIVAALLNEKAHQEVVKLAADLKKQVMAGKKLSEVADEQHLKIKSVPHLHRDNPQVPAQIVEATFKAAKPVAGKPTIFTVAMPNGEQILVSLSNVTEGVMSENDNKNKALAEKNIVNVFQKTLFDAVINGLEADADVRVALPSKQAQ